MQKYMLFIFLSIQVITLCSDKKVINLDKTGDIVFTKDRKKKSYSCCKTVCFYASKPHKVIVESGTTLDMGSLGSTIIFCGKADFVVEAGANLNFTGEKLCMTGSTKIIFTAPA